MPTIAAKHSGTCAACALPISIGEQISYEREKGARHLACGDVEPERRTNKHSTNCYVCRRRLRAGDGHLILVSETPQPDGSHRREWAARCIDLDGCAMPLRPLHVLGPDGRRL